MHWSQFKRVCQVRQVDRKLDLQTIHKPNFDQKHISVILKVFLVIYLYRIISLFGESHLICLLLAIITVATDTKSGNLYIAPKECFVVIFPPLVPLW
jgi:hypothetical protein